jgi:DNA-binding CsgD family transcriptional regulator/tetratricopeptide (TPR) repeat protein
MALLERDPARAVLRDAVQAGGGHVVLAGEAGAGKTSLVRALLEDLGPEDWVLGSCDSLSTARPLGPFLDWPGPADEVLDSVRLAVVEDVHWADDATLDLLARLVRRPHRATLLLTYRDDEVGPEHPLRLLLGDLAQHAPVRVAVTPLSRTAVAALAADSGLDPDVLHARTGGNAFFVTECLAGDTVEVSDNVRDAVLARAARLSDEGRRAVETLAVVPGRCELWLAEALGAGMAGVDEAVSTGLVVPHADGTVALRHELARLTLHDALPPGRRRDLHRAAAAALDSGPVVDHARVVHHALLGDDPERLATHAVPAADVAVAAGARSQAVAHLALAVGRGVGGVELLGRYAEQLSLVGRDTEAIAAYDDAVERARAAGDLVQLGVLLARLPGPLSTTGRMATARARAYEAVEVLESQPPSQALALAYAQVASQHMLARELDLAEPWGAKALALARELGDLETEAYTSIQTGVALWMSGQEVGLARLRSGLDLARQHDLPVMVVLGLSQIGSGGGEIRRYDEAVPALEEAMALAELHELGARQRYSQAWLGRCLLELGRWDEAAALLEPLVGSARTEAISRVTALTALGRLRARRGDPGAGALLDAALAAALPTAQLQRIWPVAAARAEAAWLSGSLDAELPLLHDTHALAAAVDYPWAADDLAGWLRRAGEPVAHSGRTPSTPEEWRAVGCPFEEALALGDDLAALPLLERLGAVPAVRRITEARRSAGLPVPRGPNAATLGNPAGLTSRELEVLQLVAAGSTNAEIAATLHLSAKTVGHHVSHILEKLGARTRTEAAAKAADLLK